MRGIQENIGKQKILARIGNGTKHIHTHTQKRNKAYKPPAVAEMRDCIYPTQPSHDQVRCAKTDYK